MTDNPRELRGRELLKALENVEAWKAKFKKYSTTATSCECLDAQIRKVVCKHQHAFRMMADIQEQKENRND